MISLQSPKVRKLVAYLSGLAQDFLNKVIVNLSAGIAGDVA